MRPAPHTNRPAPAFVTKQSTFLVGARWDGNNFTTYGPARGVAGWPVSHGSDEMNGAYVSWVATGDSLMLENDRLGMFPVFVKQQGNSIFFSNSLERLATLESSDAFDFEAFNSFLHLGFFLGEETPFKGIQALPPGANVLSTRRGVRFSYAGLHAGEPLDLEENQLRKTFAELFRGSIASCLETSGSSEISLPLSGGKDSRHIFLELLRQNARIESTVTAEPMPWLSQEDAQVARSLSALAGVPHTVLKQTSPTLEDFQKNCAHTNYCADEHAWYAVVAEHLRAKNSVVFDGLAGDVLFGGLFLSDKRVALLKANNFNALAQDIVPTYQPLKLLRAPHQAAINRQRLVERVTAELERYRDFPNPVAAFYLLNRTRREIALSPCCYLSNLSTVLMPFLDRELVDFGLRLRPQTTLGGAFHRETIKNEYNRFSSIPFAGNCESSSGGGGISRARRSMAKAVLGELLRNHRYLNRSWLLPRAFRLFVDSNYTTEGMNLSHSVAHLAGLERILKTPLSAVPAANVYVETEARKSKATSTASSQVSFRGPRAVAEFSRQ